MLNLYDGLICCRMMSLVPDVTLFIPVSASFGSFNPKLKINILKKKKISPVIGKKKKKGFFFSFFFFLYIFFYHPILFSPTFKRELND